MHVYVNHTCEISGRVLETYRVALNVLQVLDLVMSVIVRLLSSYRFPSTMDGKITRLI